MHWASAKGYILAGFVVLLLALAVPPVVTATRSSARTVYPIGTHHIPTDPTAPAFDFGIQGNDYPSGQVTIYDSGKVAATGVFSLLLPSVTLTPSDLAALMKLAEAEGVFTNPGRGYICPTPAPFTPPPAGAPIYYIRVHTTAGVTSIFNPFDHCRGPGVNRFGQLYGILERVTAAHQNNLARSLKLAKTREYSHLERADPGETVSRLIWPGALALDTHGRLYIADRGRQQILVRLPDGRFRVVAGTGKAGFGGDGGPAVRARLDVPAGMVFGPDGTLYFADEANDRIRAIFPSGIISTIAGNGKGGWVRSGTPARAAGILSPSAVTVGPDGRLYIADTGGNEVLRLERDGTLTEIAGNSHYAGVYGARQPAVHASPDGPSGLAFDRAGNLYLAGFNTKTLLMITPNGTMTLPLGKFAGFYPRGDGALVTAPNGSVYAADSLFLVRLSPHGLTTVYNFMRQRVDGIQGFLPQGIAVARNGDIYTDTALGNGFTNATALIVVRPGKAPRVLWKG